MEGASRASKASVEKRCWANDGSEQTNEASERLADCLWLETRPDLIICNLNIYFFMQMKRAHPVAVVGRRDRLTIDPRSIRAPAN